MAYWQTHKPMPQGTRIAAPWTNLGEADLAFLADVTAADGYGHPLLTQAIFDETLHVVGGAREFVVLDYFLFDDGRLTDALLARKQAVPSLRVLFVTDPLSEAYGATPSSELARLRAGGIDVVVTDLDGLRDPNFLYSSLWRLTVRWWSGAQSAAQGGWLPSPLDVGPGELGFGAWARLMNFKANHRKIVIADDGQGSIVGVVSSANPHAASTAHSNVALRLHGPVLAPLLESEMAIARFSGWQGVLGAPANATTAVVSTAPQGGARVQVLTEGAIHERLLTRIGATGPGETIDIAMFHLSDRAVIDALLAASRRGVVVRLILDPNKDAFGHATSGIPNRPVASELVTASDGRIQVRWYRTHGEQFHAKLALIYSRDTLWLTLGSANLTRSNLGDYDLEANAAVETARDSHLGRQVTAYFDTLWNNRAALGTEYTADAGVYADPSQLSYWAYRLLEVTGFGTF
jgi:phosphatidylserine/phosphatidylglycerophosphate/cardiolipin synthase-like enzyme